MGETAWDRVARGTREGARDELAVAAQADEVWLVGPGAGRLGRASDAIGRCFTESGGAERDGVVEKSYPVLLLAPWQKVQLELQAAVQPSFSWQVLQL